MIYKNKKTGIAYIDTSDSKSNKHNKHLTVVSLFSGAGGLDIGLEQAGFETVVCIENDAHCRATLKKNRPKWKVFEESTKAKDGSKREPGDIRNIEVEEVLRFGKLTKGKIALVVGGAPCQPFSNIGKKQGKNDAKNGDLFLEFVRFVKGVDPEAFIFENVAGITQQKHDEVIQYMIDKFTGLGYGLSHTILNAADYGVPQQRERFFLIGIKGVDQPAFPLPTHYEKDYKKTDKKDNGKEIEVKPWEAFINDLEPKPRIKPKNWVSIREAFDTIPKDIENRSDFAVMNISEVVQHRMTFIGQGQNFKVLPMELRPNCWRNGRHQGQDTFGRPNENNPSVTIRTAAYNPSKGMYIHPTENRGLNTIEMAALQSFPLEWEFRCANRDSITLVSGGKQIGNAVPPLLARALGIAIKKQLVPRKVESSQKQLWLA